MQAQVSLIIAIILEVWLVGSITESGNFYYGFLLGLCCMAITCGSVAWLYTTSIIICACYKRVARRVRSSSAAEKASHLSAIIRGAMCPSVKIEPIDPKTPRENI